MKRNFVWSWLLAALIAVAAPVRAEDIDIYTGGKNITGAETNILIYLDNSSNWSNAAGWTETQGEAEINALKTVIDTLTDSVNIGVMMHTRTGSVSGAYVRFAMRPMNATNRAALKATLDDLKSTAPNAPQDKVAEAANGDAAMEEVFRYFNSRPLGFPSARDSKEDYQDNADYYRVGGSVSDEVAAKRHPATAANLGTYAYNSATDATYHGPSSASAGCAKNFVIWIGNSSLDGSTATARLVAAAAEVGVTLAAGQTPDYLAQLTTYRASNTVPEGLMIDEWARFMKAYGVKTAIDDPDDPTKKIRNGIVTYTVDVFPTSAATPPASCIGDTSGGAQQVGQHYIMKSTAESGGGDCFPATNTVQLVNALKTIFAKIQAVNSVFASATLPVSVNTQGTFENQVYIGVFRPDDQARPRWYGNLKEYQFARYCDTNSNDLVDDIGGPNDERIDREAGNTGTATCSGDTLKLFLADRNNKPAIDQKLGTGFIDLTATSHWSAASTYWTFAPSTSGSVSDAPDGPMVERGGAAQQLRNKWSGAVTSPHPDGRLLYTCMGACLADGASDGQKTLSANPFVTANSDVATALTPPAGSATVSLARSGNTVTATSATAHGFPDGQTVTITGATPAAYNGTVTVAVPSTTTFTYTVSETPPLSDSANVSANAAPISVSGITLSGTTPGSTVTATVSASNTLAGGDSVTIANAGQAFLNGTRTVATAGASSFTFDVTVPAGPGAGSGGTAKAGSPLKTALLVSASYSGTTATFMTDTSKTSEKLPASFAKGVTVTIAGVFVGGTTVNAYNTTSTILDLGTSCPGGTAANKDWVFCINLPMAVTPDAGSGITATPTSSTSKPITITRVLGSTTATADVSGGHSFGVNQSITIAGATNSAYNGSWTTQTVAGSNFTFGPIPLAPSTPATGVITATAGTSGSNKPSTGNLVAWLRGKDVWEDENFNGAPPSATADVRASIHGDVLHSRPLLINYGGTIGIVGFYGSNDGFLRSVRGGTTSTDGVEQWAFMPSEFVNYDRLARLYTNQPLIRYPNTECGISPTPTKLDYFWDGQLTVFQSRTKVKYPDASTGPYERPEKTYLYAAMRRGGRAVYALDISDPAAPKYLWRITPATFGFSNLGYTWSEPKVARIKGKTALGADDVRDVLIFGGGYDPTDDDQPSGCPRGDHAFGLSTAAVSLGVTCPNAAGTYTGIGRGVYVVDALTGVLVNHLLPTAVSKNYSFPADVTPIDMDGDGNVDRIYAGNSGGELFRWDVDSTKQLTASDAFTTYFLATFGDRTDAASANRNGGTDARKFLFPPEVLPFTYTKADTTTVPAVMVLAGSGDREKPLPNRDISNNLNVLTCGALYNSSYFGSKVRDRFYGFIDDIPAGTSSGSVTAATESSMFPINTTTLNENTLASFNICFGFETTCGGATNSLYKGWYINLKNNVAGDLARDEEKIVSAPKVVSGMVLFGTNTPQQPNPAAGVCSNLGQALAYAVDPFSGLPKFDRNGDHVIDQRDFAAVVTGGGLPPTTTSGVVGIDGGYYRFVIGAGGQGAVSSSPIAGAKNPITLKGTRSRVYWYYPVDDK